MDIYEVIILMDFIGCSITICVIMLLLQVEIVKLTCFNSIITYQNYNTYHIPSPNLISQTSDQIDTVLLWKTIFFGFWPVGLIFFTCEIGQEFTNIVGKFNNEFERWNWYLFSIKIQRLLPIFIINVQEPVVIKCFGIICGSRDQFKKVRINQITKDQI